MTPGTPSGSSSVAELLCPYVGLRPFRESDAPFFFGREREVRVIASNMIASSLTVLYGPSGVGKSSVLQAGVIPILRQSADTHVIYFNTWQGRSFLTDLVDACADVAPAAAAFAAREGEPDAAVRQAARPGHRYMVILDQFEEYLRYQADEASRDRFEGALARLVNRDDSPVHVLLGIREDALWMLDRRLSIRVANLLSNTVALEHLASEQAPRVIHEPIRRWNEHYGRGRIVARIDADLVSTVLEQVRSGNVKRGRSSGAAALEEDGRNRIEIACLQLVLEELWMRAAQSEQAPFHLSLGILTEVGGADRILQTYVRSIITGRLNGPEQRICATVVHHLVTPSGAKFAQETGDLITFAKAPPDAVKRVLALLAGETGTARNLLRKSENPEKYEISHDVLGHYVLDWRLGFVGAQRLRRILSLSAAGVAVLLVPLGAWLYVVQVDAQARQRIVALEEQVNQRRQAEDRIKQERDVIARRLATARTPQEVNDLQNALDRQTQRLTAIEAQTAAAEKQRATVVASARTELDSALTQIVSLQEQLKTARQERDDARKASANVVNPRELDSWRQRALTAEARLATTPSSAPSTTTTASSLQITALQDQLRTAQRERDTAQRDAEGWRGRAGLAEQRLATATRGATIAPSPSTTLWSCAAGAEPVNLPTNGIRAFRVNGQPLYLYLGDVSGRRAVVYTIATAKPWWSNTQPQFRDAKDQVPLRLKTKVSEDRLVGDDVVSPPAPPLAEMVGESYAFWLLESARRRQFRFASTTVQLQLTHSRSGGTDENATVAVCEQR